MHSAPSPFPIIWQHVYRFTRIPAIMMNLLLASLLVLQLAGTSTPAQGPREGAVIEGIVVRLDTGEPLRRAQLTLYQVIPPGSLAAARPIDSYTEPPRFPPIDPIMTEADGVFRFTKIPAGSYLSLIHISEPTRLLSISY